MFGFGKTEFMVLEAAEHDYQSVADIHAKSFPRGWGKAEIVKLAAQDEVSLLVSRPVGKPDAPVSGFNLYRQAAGEAEILSIAIDPANRRQGLGDDLMREAIRRLQADRLEALFLEVDATNAPAVKLYERLGFATVGCRPGYYSKPGSDNFEGEPERATALVMRLELI